ncbi:hypothetical protein GCM10027174_39490 [Salinifilum aidingensis]
MSTATISRHTDWRSYVLWCEGALLVLLAGAGLVANGLVPLLGRPEQVVLGFHVNGLHGLLLLATGLGALSCSSRRWGQRRFLGGQAVVYIVVFLFTASHMGPSAAETIGLSVHDVFLHAALATAGAVLWLSLSLAPQGGQERS